MAGVKQLGFLKILFSGSTDTPELEREIKKEEAGRSRGGLYSIMGAQDIMQYIAVSQDLVKRYIDYEDMDEDPIIGSSFDLYADDVTQMDYHKKSTIWPESLDNDVVKRIQFLFDKRLKLEDNIWEMTRTLCKYGNDFEVINPSDSGVLGLDFVSPALIRRYEYDNKTFFVIQRNGEFRFSDKEVYDTFNKGERLIGNGLILENWEVIHMRLRSKNRGSRYGYGIAESARWAWKRLKLLEDATLLYKLTRAPNRLIFYVRTGNKPPQEQRAFIKDIMQDYKKSKYINALTGKLEFKTNPLAATEDIWIPLVDGKDPSRVENFPSIDYQSMDELNYFRDKEFAGLKIPKRFLTYDENADSRTAGSNDDIRFARSVLRVQRELLAGIGKTVMVDFALIGKDPRTLDYTLRMTIPSTAFEIAQLEVENTKVALAAQYNEFVSKEWILTRILGISESDAKMILRQKTKELGIELATQQAAIVGSNGTNGVYAESVLNNGKKNYYDSKQYAIVEKKMDKKLNEIVSGSVINNRKFNDVKKLLLQIRDLTFGMRFQGAKTINDSADESVDVGRFFS